jgi:hypothetical protein
MVRKKITLVQRIGFLVGFILACFFALSCISTLIVSLSNPMLTNEFIRSHFIFSKFGAVGGFLIHIIGNTLFAAVAIFFALLFWKGFTSRLNRDELVTIEYVCKKCGKVHRRYYNSFQDPRTDKYCAESGFMPIPLDNKIICDCGFEIDLSGAKNEKEIGEE